jgi:hypothetical protein
MTLKHGTRIETHGFPAFGGYPAVEPEQLTVVKPRADEAVPGPGWHIVRFANGGKLCMHESRFRVISNH